MGWNQRLDLQVAPHRSGAHRFELKRSLLPGRYQYKFITDGMWSYSADHPTMRDGDNINNYVEVGSGGDPTAEKLMLLIKCRE